MGCFGPQFRPTHLPAWAGVHDGTASQSGVTTSRQAESDRLNISFVYGIKIDMMKHFLGNTVPPTSRGTIIRQGTKYLDPTGAQT
jgi:hypothetical protein